MANEIIRPSELPPRTDPVASEVVPSDNSSTVAGVSWEDGVNSAVPPASQLESEAGVINSKRMTPLTTKQAIDAQVPGKIATAIGSLALGTASQSAVEDFATASQGTKADSALQPADIGTSVQGHGAFLDALAGMTPGSDGQVIAFDSNGDPVPTNAGAGDMLESTYDPDANEANAFDLFNQYGDKPTDFATVADLLADTSLGYSAARRADQVAAGMDVTAGGFRYRVAAIPAFDYHIATAGGVLLYALPAGDGSMSPIQWGAAADGVTDDHAILQAFHEYCEMSGTLYKYPPESFLIGDTLVIKSSGSASAAEIYADATQFSPAVRVGVTTPGGANLMRELVVALPKVFNSAKVGLGWVGFDQAIGIELASSYDCQYYVPNVTGFGIGLKNTAYGTGFSYNYIKLGVLWQNREGLLLRPGSSDAWVNENIFEGGRIGIQSGEGVNVSGTSYIRLQDFGPGATASPPNNNVFIKPSIENNVPEYSLNLQGSNNTFINPRWERTVGPHVRIYSRTEGETGRNMFLGGGYNPDNVRFVYEGESSRWNGMSSGKYTAIEQGGAKPCLALTSFSSDAVGNPHIVGLGVAKPTLPHDYESNDWNYRLYGNGFSAKRATDLQTRLVLDFANGGVTFGNGTNGAIARLGAQGASSLGVSAHFIPATDNTLNLGATGFRYAQIFAGNGTINTSDAREKDWRGGLNETELRVAKRLSKLIGIFQWKAAVAAKGDDARLHCGVKAQDVRDAFEAEGLDGFRYGLLCYDEWEAEPEEWVDVPAVMDDDGHEIEPARRELAASGHEAGDRYGIRDGQLWAFVAAGFEARLMALEDAI